MIYQSLLETIGGTPIVRYGEINDTNELYVKLELFNPAGSVKDRVAYQMIKGTQSARPS
jgi:cysteine synthase A